MLMLERNRFLDLIIFCFDPGVVDIAVAVESSEGSESFFWAVVIHEPSKDKQISSKIQGRYNEEGVKCLPWTFGEDKDQSSCIDSVSK